MRQTLMALSLFLTLTVTVFPAPVPLITWTVDGGFLAVPKTGKPPARAVGHFEMRVQADGVLEWYDQRQDAWCKARLTGSEREEVRKSIDDTPFATLVINRQAGRPTAVDGIDRTVVVQTAKGTQTLNLWQVQDGDKLPVVMEVKALQARYVK